MARYRMDDNKIVDTNMAVASWEEATYWDGRNSISKATGSQWEHEELHKSAKGRYYIERWSNWQGTTASASWVSNQEAAAWLLQNDEDPPDDLKSEVEDLCE